MTLHQQPLARPQLDRSDARPAQDSAIECPFDVGHDVPGIALDRDEQLHDRQAHRRQSSGADRLILAQPCAHDTAGQDLHMPRPVAENFGNIGPWYQPFRIEESSHSATHEFYRRPTGDIGPDSSWRKYAALWLSTETFATSARRPVSALGATRTSAGRRSRPARVGRSGSRADRNSRAQILPSGLPGSFQFSRICSATFVAPQRPRAAARGRALLSRGARRSRLDIDVERGASS